ncbi:hypothetical protein H0486_01545 [Lachnospiraceae bacterium MD1]|uniref:Nitrogen regulatory protein P-II n=1 Tax=Variimorphobacter saccharofermentans TaxID=2755051 RepID=A0A839JY86_9FIRM|nr:hypothetical protein [Variimorphobacter saccharofermentans]MBB2181579.1 hypothetical protein [Variimorphobacter saccharofermentans]
MNIRAYIIWTHSKEWRAIKLLVLILKKVQRMDDIIKQLAEAGVKGGTILDGTGMAKSLVNMEELPIFDMLKALLADEEKEACKVMLFVLKQDQVQDAKTAIKEVIGDLTAPNTGIMFTVPIDDIEGLRG